MFLAPSLAAIAVFHLYPIVQTVVSSTFALEATTRISLDNYVGLGNYIDVLGDPNFLNALTFTLSFTAAAVILDLTIGLLLALASRYVGKRLQPLVRIMIIIPWAIPPVIQASMWRWLLNSDVGVIGRIVVALGISDQSPAFLSNPYLAVFSVIAAYVWKGSSITAIFFMGGLAAVPGEYTESAMIDGAGPLRRLFAITLPIISPTIFVTLLFRTRDALRVFDIVHGLTSGGPGTATETLSSMAYRYYFSFRQFGLGSAFAVITFVLVLIVSIVYMSRALSRFNFR